MTAPKDYEADALALAVSARVDPAAIWSRQAIGVLAAALRAAEERGREAEREACIADLDAVLLSKPEHRETECFTSYGYDVVQRIRSRAPAPEKCTARHVKTGLYIAERGPLGARMVPDEKDALVNAREWWLENLLPTALEGEHRLELVPREEPTPVVDPVREALLSQLRHCRNYFEEMIEVTDSPGTLQTLRGMHRSCCDALAKALEDSK